MLFVHFFLLDLIDKLKKLCRDFFRPAKLFLMILF